MALAHPRLIEALRQTATRLESGADYRWTHMGSCNCGHLAQTVTQLSPQEIHRRALARAGDWTDQAREYCPTSGYPLDHVLEALLELGLDLSDLEHLERLSDARVLRRLPAEERRRFDRRQRAHVVLYLRAWADQLEERWLEGMAMTISLPKTLPSPEPLAAAVPAAAGRE